MTSIVRFRVYSPQSSAAPWPIYQDHWWRVPWVFLLWLVRGIRWRLRRPSLGRGVTLEDMLVAHPGKPKRCGCYGRGLIWTYKNGERGAQFCASMLASFEHRARGRVHGMRWLAGYEPETLVRPESVQRGA